MTAIKGRASRTPIPPTCGWVGCHTLLLAATEPPFPKTIITRIPHLHHGDSVIPRSREGRGSRCIRLMASRERWRLPWEVGFVGLRISAPSSSMDTSLNDLWIYHYQDDDDDDDDDFHYFFFKNRWTEAEENSTFSRHFC